MNPKRSFTGRKTQQQPVQIALPNRPRISVIIPTKNEEKLLERCLQQFTPELKQRFQLELVVSDGASSDNTIGIAAAYADFLATHESEHGESIPRQTIAEGRNRGADLAHAELLVFLNADTIIADVDLFLQRVVQRFDVDESLAALATRVEVLPEERRWSDRLFHAYFNRYVRYANLIGLGIGRGECQIVRRKAFRALHGYNPSMAAGEDFDLFRRMRSLGRVKFDPKLLVFESPRRYRKYGYARVYFDWIRNGFSVLLRNHSAQDVWEEVR